MKLLLISSLFLLWNVQGDHRTGQHWARTVEPMLLGRYPVLTFCFKLVSNSHNFERSLFKQGSSKALITVVAMIGLVIGTGHWISGANPLPSI